jgi:hypothetical protein
VKYRLNLSKIRTFQPVNFSCVYSARLVNEARELRTYSIVEKQIPLTAHGTKYIRILKISNVEYDTLILKVECQGLRHYHPLFDVHLVVKSDLFAIRKWYCHVIFLVGSVIVFGSFLIWWNHPLQKVRSILVMLLLVIISHQCLTDFGFPTYFPIVEIVVSHLERCFVKLAFVNATSSFSGLMVLGIIQFLLGSQLDIEFQEADANTRHWLILFVVVVLVQLVDLGLTSSHFHRGILCFVLLSMNDLLALYEFRVDEPANWFVIPIVLPDLFVYYFAGLMLDDGEAVNSDVSII